jgi:hypothetical protein
MGVKEKICTACGTASGGLSILGGANICHTICMSIIGLLSFVGITVAGMPLMFLQKWALPLWVLAVAMLGFMLLLLYGRGIQFSRKTLLANAGLIVAGVPFAALDAFRLVLYVIGGSMVTASVAWALTDKRVKQ